MRACLHVISDLERLIMQQGYVCIVGWVVKRLHLLLFGGGIVRKCGNLHLVGQQSLEPWTSEEQVRRNWKIGNCRNLVELV